MGCLTHCTATGPFCACHMGRNGQPAPGSDCNLYATHLHLAQRSWVSSSAPLTQKNSSVQLSSLCVLGLWPFIIFTHRLCPNILVIRILSGKTWLLGRRQHFCSLVFSILDSVTIRHEWLSFEAQLCSSPDMAPVNLIALSTSHPSPLGFQSLCNTPLSSSWASPVTQRAELKTE